MGGGEVTEHLARESPGFSEFPTKGEGWPPDEEK